jgi:AraC-like DNA-binding protein
LGTNSKYLNEILKIYKDKTFSQYINDLRIDYITKLLYEEPKSREYKISYLAEICGFSSREVFAVAFKKKMGISPSYFIENLRKEKN